MDTDKHRWGNGVEQEETKEMEDKMGNLQKRPIFEKTLDSLCPRSPITLFGNMKNRIRML